MPCSIAEKLLCFNDYGKEKNQIKTNRFVQQYTSLSSTTKKIHMPNFLIHLKNKKKTKTKPVKLSTKQLPAQHKSFEVFRSPAIPIVETLHYDLFPTNFI